ncbi:MAG: hypothetical protein KatS3mg060_1852 [Dehalococcoidia bacterium]|nr:MAG: hypothetical protein KatS3mg060_1852 [Dehalococcoidia bacterium]
MDLAKRVVEQYARSRLGERPPAAIPFVGFGCSVGQIGALFGRLGYRVRGVDFDSEVTDLPADSVRWTACLSSLFRQTPLTGT